MTTLDDCVALVSDAPNCLAFLRAWQGWRRDGGVPTTADVRPEDLGRAMSALAVYDITDENRLTFRLAGDVQDLMAFRPLKGQVLSDLLDPPEHAATIARARALRRLPCGVMTLTTTTAKSGRQATLRSLFLPVADARTGAVTRAFSAVDPGARPGRGLPDPTVRIAVAERVDFIDLGFGVPAA
ncbi:MAG: PAS domain-containing protein [Pseudomonadota bacterium]|nr:PAS domain-containing protein [Pseudomonadota bacterium]